MEKITPSEFRVLSLKGGNLSVISQGVSEDYCLLETRLFIAIKELIVKKGVLSFLTLFMAVVFRGGEKGVAYLCQNNLKRRQIRLPWLYGNFLLSGFYVWQKKISCRLQLEYFEQALIDYQPTSVLVWNGSLMPNSILKTAAQNLGYPVTFFEGGYYPNTLQVDNQGINGANSLPRGADFYLSKVDDLTSLPYPNHLNTRIAKNKEITNQTNQLDGDYIFVPFQVPSDMQILELSPWITSMLHCYEELYAVAEKLENVQFVVKEHPSFKLSIQNKIKKHPRIVFANTQSTQELIELSSAVISINSTVGLEAVTLHKPVITLGTACYNVEGLVQHASSHQSLFNCVNNLSAWQPNERLKESFVRYVNNHYLISGNWNDPDLSAIKDRILKLDHHAQKTNEWDIG